MLRNRERKHACKRVINALPRNGFMMARSPKVSACAFREDEFDTDIRRPLVRLMERMHTEGVDAIDVTVTDVHVDDAINAHADLNELY